MKLEIGEIYQPVRGGLARVEEALRRLASADSPALTELLQHVLGKSGKRLRPALNLLVGQAFGCDEERLVPMATAVELFHTATLVHDDTVDGSSLRRGKPTVSSRWGTGKAVLFGDYLFALAAELASTTGNLRVVTLFAQTLRMVSSSELSESFKVFDLSQTRQRYYENINCKTASLFVLATESAALLSGAGEADVATCRRYGYNLGMAFQVVDDILDFVGAEEDMGKPVGGDLLRGVVTLPVILAIERNQEDPRVRNMLVHRGEATLRAVLGMAADPALIRDSYEIAAAFCARAREEVERLCPGVARDGLLGITDYVMSRRN